MGPRAGLGGCEKFRLQRLSIPGPFSPLRVGIPTELTRPTLKLCTYIPWHDVEWGAKAVVFMVSG